MSETVENVNGLNPDESGISARGPAIAEGIATPSPPDPSTQTLTLKVAMADPVSPQTTADIPAEPGPATDEQTAADLKAQLSELKDLLRSEQSARVQAENSKRAQAEAQRREWLEKQGLVKWDYQTLAPTVEQADPFTEEGRRVLAKFRTDNPHLFKGSPEPPPARPGIADKIGRKTWRDIMGGASRGLNY